VVTLGRFSMAHYLPNAKISSVHGQATKIKNRLVVAMYHPAAALHQQSLKSIIEKDFARLPELIAGGTSSAETSFAQFGQTAENPEQKAGQPVEKQNPKQLSLF